MLIAAARGARFLMLLRWRLVLLRWRLWLRTGLLAGFLTRRRHLLLRRRVDFLTRHLLGLRRASLGSGHWLRLL
jgi:hypothetical protein